VHLGIGDEPPFSGSTRAQNVAKTYDFFISHAHEDKEDFVRPLAGGQPSALD
jgi:hypothetical protein